MNKTELIDAIAAKTDIAKTQVGAMLDAFLETVVDEVAKGESLRLIGFGTFGPQSPDGHRDQDPGLQGPEVHGRRFLQGSRQVSDCIAHTVRGADLVQ